MSPAETTEFLPSIAQILKRANALERVTGVDVQAVARLPVFAGRSWKRSIAEFLRWSGTTPDAWGTTSVFELLLCHGPEGARAIFAAYQEDRLERAETFAEAASELEAVRTVISMAAHWLQAIPWDLRGVPRLIGRGVSPAPARRDVRAAGGRCRSPEAPGVGDGRAVPARGSRATPPDVVVRSGLPHGADGPESLEEPSSETAQAAAGLTSAAGPSLRAARARSRDS